MVTGIQRLFIKWVKNMKKILTILTIIGIIIFIPFSAFADNYNFLNSTLSEIQTDEVYILSSANDLLGNHISSPIISADLDYSKAMKVYIETALLDNNNSSFSYDAFQSSIANSDYVYLLPVTKDGQNILLTISMGQPITERAEDLLSEEEIEKLEVYIGKWCVASASTTSLNYDYKSLTEYVLGEEEFDSADIFFVGGLVTGLPLTAVCFPDNTDALFIDLYSVKTASTIAGGLSQTSDFIYSYEDVVDIASENPLESDEVGGIGIQKCNRQRTFGIVLSVAVFSIAVGTAAIISVRKRASSV